jgi:DNA-binding MarR family transcriptional regulator
MDALPADLARVFGRIGRALRYRTRAARRALGVTDSEYDLLRLVGRQPGIRVLDAARDLDIASNSVSTLVKQLSRVGLLERASDPDDGRAARLHLTVEGERLLGEVGSVREEAVARALDGLEPRERMRIEHALAALNRLGEELNATVSAHSDAAAR